MSRAGIDGLKYAIEIAERIDIGSSPAERSGSAIIVDAMTHFADTLVDTVSATSFGSSNGCFWDVSTMPASMLAGCSQPVSLSE